MTWTIIQQNPNRLWNWGGVTQNLHVTWEIIHEHLDKPWDWFGLCRSPKITWDSWLDAARVLSVLPVGQKREVKNRHNSIPVEYTYLWPIIMMPTKIGQNEFYDHDYLRHKNPAFFGVL